MGRLAQLAAICCFVGVSLIAWLFAYFAAGQAAIIDAATGTSITWPTIIVGSACALAATVWAWRAWR
jgi:hypothetical protein